MRDLYIRIKHAAKGQAKTVLNMKIVLKDICINSILNMISIKFEFLSSIRLNRVIKLRLKFCLSNAQNSTNERRCFSNLKIWKTRHTALIHFLFALIAVKIETFWNVFRIRRFLTHVILAWDRALCQLAPWSTYRIWVESLIFRFENTRTNDLSSSAQVKKSPWNTISKKKIPNLLKRIMKFILISY